MLVNYIAHNIAADNLSGSNTTPLSVFTRDTKFSKAETSECRIGAIQRSLYKVKNFNTILVPIFSTDLVIRVVRLAVPVLKTIS